MPEPTRTGRTRAIRLGARQAERLFQLSCGYMICQSDPDPYKALRAKGYVEDSTRRWRAALGRGSEVESQHDDDLV